MKRYPIRILKVEEVVSRISGVKVEDMRRKCRSVEFSEARMFVWFICYELMGFSYSEIGELYDRDHTTIIHGVNKMRANQEQVNDIYLRIKEIFPEVFTERSTARTLENWTV